MVSLINLSRTVHTYILVHALVCTEEECSCGRQLVGVTDHDHETGKKNVRALRRKLADSVTIMSKGTDGDTVHGLPDGVLRLPEVKAALAKGEVRALKGKDAENVHQAHLAAQQKRRDEATAEAVKRGDPEPPPKPAPEQTKAAAAPSPLDTPPPQLPPPAPSAEPVQPEPQAAEKAVTE